MLGVLEIYTPIVKRKKKGDQKKWKTQAQSNMLIWLIEFSVGHLTDNPYVKGYCWQQKWL